MRRPGRGWVASCRPLLREVRIEALPTAIPEHVEASVETLELGDMLRLEDVAVPEGMTFLDDPQTLVASCLAPRGLTDEEIAAEEAAEAGIEPADDEADADAEEASEES